MAQYAGICSFENVCSRKLADVQREWADKEEELRRRHASELARVREQATIERDQWQKAMNDKIEQERGDAFAAMQKKLEKQRDDEIEVVIVRLEEEAEATKAKLKNEAEEKAQRVIELVSLLSLLLLLLLSLSLVFSGCTTFCVCIQSLG